MHALRQKKRRRRRLLGVGAQIRAARRLSTEICCSMAYRRSQKLAFYLACDGEIACDWLIKQAWLDGKLCYLPVLDQADDSPYPMRFVRYDPGSPLRVNPWGIFEPVSGSLCQARDLDLVCLPLVAFDAAGHRIGMGGGYYDRTFADLPARRRPLLWGVAHRQQQVDALSPQPWDLVLDKVFAV